MRYVVATALLALLAAASAAGSSRPTLALVKASPVVVHGSGFTPGHVVSVTYASGTARVRRTATAGARGTVSAVFRGVTFSRCRGATIRAQTAAALVILPCSAPGGTPTLGGTIAGFVHGAAFVPGEHVRLTGRVSDTEPVTVTADAGAAGTFSAQLTIQHAACGELFVRAVGALGSTATFTAAAPACKTP
jgi:hypothetical protein